MKVEIIEMADTKAKFILKDSTPAMANALRRTMLSDIPKMAIDSVDFLLGSIDVDGKGYESTTPLFNEIIAHRLGLVPVPTDLDLFTFQDKCTCGGVGCPSCRVMYSIKKNGPCTVTSGDMIPVGGPELKVKDENIPIVELADGQSVMIYANAVMGTARKHVKWQVANAVGYKYLPVISVEKGNDGNAEAIAKACPKSVFDVEGGKLVAKRPLDCSLCMTCVENFPNGPVSIKGDDTNFVFTFETDGSLTAQKVLDKAAEILSQEFKDFGEQVAAL
jgi:DNA-directed RNA polymerase subunit D